jgi:tetratricopeptide (TPR) repeat protein
LEGFLYRNGASKDLSPFLIMRRADSLDDYPSRLVAVHGPYFKGKDALAQGQKDLAQRWFNLALEWGRRMSWLASNIGGVQAQYILIPEARVAFERAVQNDPYFFEAQYGLGFSLLKQNQLEGAIKAYKMATKVAPHRAEGFYMLGVAHQNAGHLEDCKKAWDNYITLEPRGKMAGVIRKEMEDMKWK